MRPAQTVIRTTEVRANGEVAASAEVYESPGYANQRIDNLRLLGFQLMSVRVIPQGVLVDLYRSHEERDDV